MAAGDGVCNVQAGHLRVREGWQYRDIADDGDLERQGEAVVEQDVGDAGARDLREDARDREGQVALAQHLAPAVSKAQLYPSQSDPFLLI